MKNKIYALIGRATVFLTGWGISVYALYKLVIIILDNCCTTLR